MRLYDIIFNKKSSILIFFTLPNVRQFTVILHIKTSIIKTQSKKK